MKSLIRSIFKSRKKIFKRIRFLFLLRMVSLAKPLLVKKNKPKLKSKLLETKSLTRKNDSYNSRIGRKKFLQNYLMEHTSVLPTNIPFILKFIEIKGCLFADKLLIEQLIVLAHKKLSYQINHTKSFLWLNFISNQRTNVREKFYFKG